MYSIYLSKQAKKFLSTCDEILRRRIEDLLEILVEDPLPIHDYDIAKVKGLKKGYRIRLGTLRVIIELNLAKSEILILKIDKRSRAYRDL